MRSNNGCHEFIIRPEHPVRAKMQFGTTMNLAYPIIIGQLGHMMMSVVDNVMVGKLGPVPLAGASLGNAIFMQVMVIGLGISFAITPLVAMADGVGNHDECGVVFRQGLLVNTLSGIILMVIVLSTTGLIIHLRQPDEVVIEAIPYLRMLGLSMLPFMIFQSYRQFTEGISIIRPAMIITIGANIFNIFFNWIFIFGKMGFPAMGLKGAGISTFGTRVVMALVLAWYVMKSDRFTKYDPTLRFRRIDFEKIKRILRIGIPSGFTYFFEVSAFSGAAFMIGWIGTNELAAHQIAINLASASFMFAVGVSAAGVIRVGNAVGRKDIPGTRSAGFSAVILAASIMALNGLIFVVFRRELSGFYIENQDVISIASSLLIIAAIFQISDGIQAAGVGILRGMADTKIPTIITFIAYWIIGLPAGYILGFPLGLGVQGVWIGLLLGLTASAFLLTIRFNIKSKKLSDI
ncbi:MAG: MATE family efflux transporter [Calditrichaceae bacterium]